jgi:hypothetical protein
MNFTIHLQYHVNWLLGSCQSNFVFADVIKPRETITSGTDWSRVVRLSPDVDAIDVDLST